MKDRGEQYDLNWERIERAKSRKANENRCNMCCLEAIEIMNKYDKAINSRKELADTCLHRRRYLMLMVKGIPPPDNT